MTSIGYEKLKFVAMICPFAVSYPTFMLLVRLLSVGIMRRSSTSQNEDDE